MKKLNQAVDDYLLWMISSGYADKSIQNYQKVLENFVHFVACHKISWDHVFLSENLEKFHQITKHPLAAVRGFCRYLVSYFPGMGACSNYDAYFVPRNSECHLD